jgi:hypothetical protein
VESDEEMRLVLRELRLGGFNDTEVLAARTGLDAPLVAAILDAARSRDWVAHRSGRLTGWSLTAAGRAEGERLLSEELDAANGRQLVTDAYRSFLPLNREFLELCTDWQLRPDGEAQTLNDHLDAGYDESVIARLDALHGRLAAVVGRLSSALPRFTAYDPRFTFALAQVHAGELDWFTKPLIDSYHTVWFELHEDVLGTLGIERSRETSS